MGGSIAYNVVMKFLQRPLMLIIWLLLAIFVGLLRPETTIAQTTVPRLIYEGELFQALAWSTNSETFSFFLYSSPPPTVQSAAFLFSVESTTLTNAASWPFQPIISDEEASALKLWKDQNGIFPFIYLSPDSHSLVYPGIDETSKKVSTLFVSNLERLQAIVIPIEITFPFASSDAFNVLWSTDSTAFAVAHLGGQGFMRIDYAQLEKDATTGDLKSARVESVNTAAIGETTYVSGVYGRLYDISDDGLWVLVLLDEFAPGYDPNTPRVARLVVWSPTNPAESYAVKEIPGEQIRGASFAPDDKTKLLIITDSGLVKYDLKTQTQDLITAEISSKWVDDAVFSPNGRWVALIDIAYQPGVNRIYLASTEGVSSN
ncbi:MAG: hypothetical protein U0528_12235 [Anaerolineae bacterium]